MNTPYCPSYTKWMTTQNRYSPQDLIPITSFDGIGIIFYSFYVVFICVIFFISRYYNIKELHQSFLFVKKFRWIDRQEIVKSWLRPRADVTYKNYKPLGSHYIEVWRRLYNTHYSYHGQCTYNRRYAWSQLRCEQNCESVRNVLSTTGVENVW